ncbi:MAG TPA: helix-turn-helix domain-containing protein [Stellaceae bacterium]|nr:helix-turn-helix domain-containing protein [Stellaceae bacterium]
MSASNAQSPHPIDHHVGARLRRRRVEMRWSQTALARRLGVTFQAVQKYETGTVRLSASRLFEVSKALGVTPGYFFEGYGEDATPHGVAPADLRAEATLLRGYYGIRDSELQADLRRLVARLGGAPD